MFLGFFGGLMDGRQPGQRISLVSMQGRENSTNLIVIIGEAPAGAHIQGQSGSERSFRKSIFGLEVAS